MNVAVACVPLTLLITYGVRGPVMLAQAKFPGGYDNHTPRRAQHALTGLAARAQGAHENGFEAFMGFAAAVALAQGAGIAASPAVTGFAVVHVLARAADTAAYVSDWPTVRSMLWFVGFLSTLSIFGHAVANAA